MPGWHPRKKQLRQTKKGQRCKEDPNGELPGKAAGQRDNRAKKAERDKENANKVAQQVRRAAALTAELAAQSEKKTAAVCDQPPGLDELAGHIEAPNMGAGGSHPQATMMPDPWATYKCPSASQAMITNPLPASQSFSNFSGKSRKGRPRSNTRAQDNTAVLEETLRLFVEATGKDEASMRQQLVSKRSVEML